MPPEVIESNLMPDDSDNSFEFDDDNLFENDAQSTPPTPDIDVPNSGVIRTYLAELRESLSSEISIHGTPKCYKQGHFWIRPVEPYFAMRNALASSEGVAPEVLYHPSVFLWLPHLLDNTVLTCQNPNCIHFQKTGKPLSPNGWNSDPIARRVVDLDRIYYVMTQRVRCDQRSGGCGKSTNLYDPIIMAQLEPGLAASFPAFLTHRSGIDKTVLTLVRAGVAHRMSSSAWSKVLRELHVREHDLQELNYLHAVLLATKRERSLNHEGEKTYSRFSTFDDKDGYGGFSPSRWYINTVYQDYMEHIRPYLDQCVATLPGHVIKWDHSFKLPKFLMKLEGETTFASLFTLVNEFEQIRFQAFVPTKSLVHVEGALEEMVKSLDKYGLSQPMLGFTDNVGSDAATFMRCIPSLAAGVEIVQLDEFSKLPRAVLLDSVTVQTCRNEVEIQTSCDTILHQVSQLSADQTFVLGTDIEFEFTIGHASGGPQKTALITLATPTTVYLLQVFHLRTLPISLITILNSPRILKIGRNAGGDLAKLARDFSAKVPEKTRNGRAGVVEIGSLARSKNVVSSGNASLAAIAAATLSQNLSKEERISNWTTSHLTEEQKTYAALDAWILLEIYKYLQTLPTTGQILKSASPMNQCVSLFCKKQEVAQGIVVKQPETFNIHRTSPSDMTVSVNVTCTRAVIKINKVIAPDFILPFHKQSLGNVQAGRPSFEVLVNLSSVRTRVDRVAATEHSDAESAVMDEVTVQKPPPELANQADIMADPDSDSEINDDDDILLNPYGDYSQNTSASTIPSRILADAFHEIDKVCRTISKKHTHHDAFARAFSSTLFVTDKNDCTRVEAYLQKHKMPSFDKVRLEKPDWLWRRVRRYIPEKNLLVKLLGELFECWGPVKCTITGQPLFSSDTWKKSEGVLHDVRKGWISDPVGIPLYNIRFTDKNGLPVYHCIRGTNSVEGAVHNPIRRNFASLNASVELADSLIADFRHRHNLDVGTQHRTGKDYTGHYDPWLEHEIAERQADINWAEPPLTISVSMHDIDPFAFPPTLEQFGITCIPGVMRLDYDFNGPAPISSQDLSLSLMHVYPSKLHLAKLKGKRNDVYGYLAAAQRTKFAVTPLHTKEEYMLYNEVVTRGGQDWCPQAGKPIFAKLAAWWSSQADGKTIFYKLPEQLSTHHKQWLNRRNQSQSIIASEPQRQRHSQRIQSVHYTASVLPPASRLQPGVMQAIQPSPLVAQITPSIISPVLSVHERASHSVQEGLLQGIATGSRSLSRDSADPQPIQSLTLAPTPIVIVPTPLIPQPQFTFQHMSANLQPIAARGRRCRLCVESGRDGVDCPGKTNRKYCRWRDEE